MKARGPALLEPSLERARSVKLIGLGGVGGIVARYLTIFLGAFREQCRLVLVDGDSFEEKNATRMLFARPGNKAAVIRESLLPDLRCDQLELATVEEYVNEDNLARLIRAGDLVILCVDNHATRKLVNDHCARLDEVCLISGGNDGVGPDGSGRTLRGTYGNVQTYLRRDGEDHSPALDAYHPELRDPPDDHPEALSCVEALESTPQVLFANLMTASSILNALLLYVSGELHYSEACFDLWECAMSPSPIPAPRLGAEEPSA